MTVVNEHIQSQEASSLLYCIPIILIFTSQSQSYLSDNLSHCLWEISICSIVCFVHQVAADCLSLVWSWCLLLCYWFVWALSSETQSGKQCGLNCCKAAGYIRMSFKWLLHAGVPQVQTVVAQNHQMSPTTSCWEMIRWGDKRTYTRHTHAHTNRWRAEGVGSPETFS